MSVDISESALAILRLLYGASEPVRASFLAQETGYSRFSVYQALDKLVSEGLVRAHPAESGGKVGRPAKTFELTDAGLGRAEEAA